MNQQLQDKIVNEFPKLFKNFLNQKDTFWIPDGWFDLVYNLSKEVNEIRNATPNLNDDDCIVVQIKNKFGGLRYYMNDSHPIISELIAIAEDRSYNICTVCGFDSKFRIFTTNSYNYCDTCSIIKNIIE